MATRIPRCPALIVALTIWTGLTLALTAVPPIQAAAPPITYSFESLATLPQAAPGIPTKYLARDFEIGGFNNSATSFWAADFNASGAQPPWAAAEGEGLWITHQAGAPDLVARSGGLDPEGVTFSNGFPGPVSINDAGDGAFAFRLLPAPCCGANAVLNAGVYRYDHVTDGVTTIAKTGSPAPGGGTFAGFNFGTSINGSGNVVFQGVIKTPNGTYPNPADGLALYGVGIFKADSGNTITPVVVPGDPAPSGGNFNNLRNSWLNDHGDIAFGGHTTAAGEAACATLSCSESIYQRYASNSTIVSIAHRGDLAPVPGGLKYDYAFGPRNNNRGQLVFVGCLTPTVGVSCGNNRGVFWYHDGVVSAVAYPGLVFQAEGTNYTAIRASNTVNNYYINDAGDIVFALQYDADANGDGAKDSGVFTYSGGVYEVVAKTGDVIPGVGTVAHIAQPVNAAAASSPNGYSLINNRGQVMFQATLSNGTGVLLLASPTPAFSCITADVTVKCAAVADSRTSSGSPSSNFGYATYLRTRGTTSPLHNSYLKFDVRGLNGTVQDAKLRLYAYDGGNNGGPVYSVPTTWTETGIKWTNQPPLTGTPLSTLGAVPTDSWAEYSVTSAITTGLLSFGLTTPSADSLYFHSREAFASQKPELVITLNP